MKFSSLFKAFVAATALVAMLPATLQATDYEEVTQLSLHLTNGKTERFNLPDKPVISFDGESMQVKSNEMEASYLRTDIDYFNFEKGKVIVSVDAIDASTEMSVTYLDNTTLIVVAPGLRALTISTISGTTVLTVAAVDGVATADLSNLPSGVYVVVPEGHKTFKIIRK